jgi:hypothetical protein
MGFVPKTTVFDRVGDTSGDVFVDVTPIKPSFMAISVYHWQMPKWFEPLAVTQPTPFFLAFSIARRMLEH